MNRRVTIALFVAPLMVPVLLVPYLQSMGGAPSFFAFALEVSIVLSYCGTFVLGIPAYLFLRARNWTAFWIAPLAGFIAGFLMWLVFRVLFVLALGQGITGALSKLTDSDILKGAVWPG